VLLHADDRLHTEVYWCASLSTEQHDMPSYFGLTSYPRWNPKWTKIFLGRFYRVITLFFNLWVLGSWVNPTKPESLLAALPKPRRHLPTSIAPPPPPTVSSPPPTPPPPFWAASSHQRRRVPLLAVDSPTPVAASHLRRPSTHRRPPDPGRRLPSTSPTGPDPRCPWPSSIFYFFFKDRGGCHLLLFVWIDLWFLMNYAFPTWLCLPWCSLTICI
jgi:hypothetical protein